MLLAIVLAMLLAPCAKYLSFLFTPYGYKFAEGGGDWLSESWTRTNVGSPFVSPWKFVSSGSLGNTDLGRIGSGFYWYSTPSYKNDTNAYRLEVTIWNVYMSFFGDRFSGFSVRKFFTVLFTPYEYKFEGMDKYNEIFENYEKTGVAWPNKKLWIFVKSGYVNYSTNGIFGLNGAGEYRSGTIHSKIVSSYHYSLRDNDMFPAYYWDKYLGFSVHGY